VPPRLTLGIASSLVGLALSLLIPSTQVVQKYFGLPGVPIYLVLASAALFFVCRYVFTGFASRASDKQVLWLTAATFLVLLALFLVVYPMANSGIAGGGSDRDDALNIATTELLRGRYPYYVKTYLGNPISPLPGSLALAAPFVLIGNSAYQNLFWLLAFLLSMNAYLKDRRAALLLLWTVFALSPLVLNEFLTGGDLLANSIFVLLSVVWMVTAIPRPGFNRWGKILLAVLFGVGLASRFNFLLILPLVFSALARSVGWRSAAKYTAIACLSFGLMTAPLYLHDPQGFSPLHTANKLSQFQTILPFAGIIVPLAAGVTALLLSLQPSNRTLHVLLRNCAIVLAVPVVSGAILRSIAIRDPDFSFTAFGLAFLFFGAAAFWPSALGIAPASPPADGPTPDRSRRPVRSSR
jgi:hypothetical protein